MKALVFFAWACVILTFTWTENLNGLLYSHDIGFKWVWLPDYSQLLQGIGPINFDKIFIKSGHFMGYGLLAVLYYRWKGKFGHALLMGITLAVTSELLQLHFTRDGRMIDMLIDITGMFTLCTIQRFFYREKSRTIHMM